MRCDAMLTVYLTVFLTLCSGFVQFQVDLWLSGHSSPLSFDLFEVLRPDGTDALEHGERAALLPLRLLGHQRRRRDLQGLQGDRVLRGLSGADAIIVFP